MDDENLATKIFNTYLTETSKRIKKIHKSINNGESQITEKETHTLKGSSANVGAVIMQDIAQKMEISANNEDLKKAAALLPSLEKQFKIVKGIFHENINSGR